MNWPILTSCSYFSKALSLKKVVFLRDEAGKSYVTDSGPELFWWFSSKRGQDEKILLMIQTALKFILSVQTREDFSYYAQQGQTEGAVPGIVHCTPSSKL